MTDDPDIRVATTTKLHPEPGTEPDSGPVIVAALYRFADQPDFHALRAPLLHVCRQHGVMGTLLLAREGINGTIAGSRTAIDAVVTHIRAIGGFETLELKTAQAAHMPFLRMKVRLKKEIVTLGVAGLDPVTNAGTYVEPKHWNALISDPDVVVVDTRNAYETRIGSFEGALDPGTASFAEFPEWLRTRPDLKSKKIAMFCTGGIRCEKATALLRSEGFEDVYHLKGGILKYLEDIPPGDSLWQGACFVFDDRVAVSTGLQVAPYTLCRGCREPLGPAERASPDFEDGVSCPHCRAGLSDRQRERRRERHRQVLLAERRGGSHLGGPADRPLRSARTG